MKKAIKKSNTNNDRNGNNPNLAVRRVRKKRCNLCLGRVDIVDPKDIGTLQRYITDRGKIAPRRLSGLCPKHQRAVARAVKCSRVIALLPYVID